MDEIIRKILEQENDSYTYNKPSKNVFNALYDSCITDELLSYIKEKCGRTFKIKVFQEEMLKSVYEKYPDYLRWFSTHLTVSDLKEYIKCNNINSTMSVIPSLYWVDKVYDLESEKTVDSFKVARNIKKIEDYAFCYCDELTKIDFSEANKNIKISPKAFYGCSKLEFDKIDFPENVKSNTKLMIELRFYAEQKRGANIYDADCLQLIFCSYIGRPVFPFGKGKCYGDMFFPDFDFYEDIIESVSPISDLINKDYFGDFGFINLDVKLITKRKMKKYNRNFDDYKLNLIEAIVNEINDISDSISETNKMNNAYKVLYDDLEQCLSRLVAGNNLEAYWKLKDPLISGTFKKIDYKILKRVRGVLDNIKSLKINGNSLLGVYVSNTRDCTCIHQDHIYICLDNIVEEVSDTAKKTKGSFNELEMFVDLTKSVLVHEYVHCLQSNCPLSKDAVLNDENQGNCVFETIAECMQRIFIYDKCGEEAKKWIDSHSRIGLFPRWPYAGAT